MDFIEQLQDFVYNLLKDKLSASFIYHNYNHTSDVVKAVQLLSEQENLSPLEKEILVVAAWFHDTGYINGFENHEENSAQIASEYLSKEGKSAEYIAQVKDLILVTKYDQLPQTISEKIIKDADFYHFTLPNYCERCELLRGEWEIVKHKQATDLEWANENVKMLTQCHQYFTPYAIANWQPLKDKNISLLQEKINQMEEENTPKKAKKNK